MKIINPSDIESKENKNNPFFIGKVSAKFIISQDDAPDITLGLVTFAPGARNVFHTHTAGQILYAVKGEGIVATEEEEFKLKPGMVLTFPPVKNTGTARRKTPPFHISRYYRRARLRRNWSTVWTIAFLPTVSWVSRGLLYGKFLRSRWIILLSLSRRTAQPGPFPRKRAEGSIR